MEKIKPQTPLQKADVILTMFSKMIVWIAFIFLFVIMIRFDKNLFLPEYKVVSYNYQEFKKEKIIYGTKSQLHINDNDIKNLNEYKKRIELFSEYYNQNIGFVKNKQMMELREVYSDYILKINEINKNARHGNYISKVQYDDLVEFLPTKKQMDNINRSLPKPFLKTLLISVVLAFFIQFLVYLTGMACVKLYLKVLKKGKYSF